jgi:hypothetical protein
MKLRLSSLGLLLYALIATPAYATIVPIDLNDFSADPTVSVVPDGTSATLEEDPFLIAVLLYNDPGLGDPEVIIPGVGTKLSFDFDFTEGMGEDDEFVAFVLNAATGLPITGFEFSTATSSSGSVLFDLTSLDGLTLGLEFQLISGFSDTNFNSTVVVSNVQLETPMPAVPEPSTLVLLSLGLAGLSFTRRRMKV